MHFDRSGKLIAIQRSHEQKVSGYREETKHDAMTIFTKPNFSSSLWDSIRM